MTKRKAAPSTHQLYSGDGSTLFTITSYPLPHKGRGISLGRNPKGQVLLLPPETLQEALQRVDREQWSQQAAGASSYSQARIAVNTVLLIYGAPDGTPVLPSDITGHEASKAVDVWKAEGLGTATIHKRLNCLSKLGVNIPAGLRPPKKRQLKWFLSEADRKALNDAVALDEELGDFINWTVFTGLRITESLALRFSSFTEHLQPTRHITVKVPGLKTEASEATLVLSPDAAEIVNRRLGYFLAAGARCRFEDTLWTLDYDELARKWEGVRHLLGQQDNPTATLKALRRSAARYLHYTLGMPLDMVRQYLRHDSIETTMEYLRLTGGGASTTEQLRFLHRAT